MTIAALPQERLEEIRARHFKLGFRAPETFTVADFQAEYDAVTELLLEVNAAVLALGHLEAAAGYLDLLSGESRTPWPYECIITDDPGTEVLGIASAVRKAMTGSDL